MITVHYLDNSRAHRILWLLEELDLAYQVTNYIRSADMRAPESLKAVHPLGKSPVIEDEGVVVAESGAIIEYLVETYGDDTLRPPAGSEARLRYTYWTHYAEGSAMPLLLLKLIFAKLPRQVPWPLRPFARLMSKGVADQLIDPQITEHIAYWDAELSRDRWFAGPEFSAADIAMSFPVEAGMARIAALGASPSIIKWVAAIRSRPAYQRALSRGGAYDYAAT